MKGKIWVLLYVLCALCISSCHEPTPQEISFYYWKPQFLISKENEQLLQETRSKTLYLRFFDIKWNNAKSTPYPEARIDFRQKLTGLTIVPVIYITNDTFKNLKPDETDSLALNANTLIKAISEKNGIVYQSIQVDCDWTLSTRDKYFRFLMALQHISRRPIEATIRLHQVKYRDKTGIPPVAKGVLMFYNMGQLNARLDGRNSIYNETDAARYSGYIKSYPMQLDVALPLFSWFMHIRKGKILKIYGKLKADELASQPAMKAYHQHFMAKKSFFFRGIYVKENDIFKLERMNAQLLTQAAKQLSSSLPENKKRRIIFYELSNLDHSIFKAEIFKQVSSEF